jgi:uncharacterized protein (TIGR02996 family)
LTEEEAFLNTIADEIVKSEPDWTVLLIYADWLEDRGRKEATGWRWIAEQHQKPREWRHKATTYWCWQTYSLAGEEAARLNAAHFDRLYRGQADITGLATNGVFRDYLDPLEALMDLAEAVS